MNPAPNLILVGPMGAGKSSIGRHLARLMGLSFVDLDDAIEARTGATVNLIFELEGEAGFRKREHALLTEFCQQRGLCLATGGGTVVSAENRALLRAHGYVVYLRVALEQQLRRLARDHKRPLLHGPERRSRLIELAQTREPWYCEVADLDVPGGNAPVAVAAERLAQTLAQTWRRDDAMSDAKSDARSSA
jgi:shikimate kinase